MRSAITLRTLGEGGLRGNYHHFPVESAADADKALKSILQAIEKNGVITGTDVHGEWTILNPRNVVAVTIDKELSKEVLALNE